jgi:hypothetical protein
MIDIFLISIFFEITVAEKWLRARKKAEEKKI